MLFCILLYRFSYYNYYYIAWACKTVLIFTINFIIINVGVVADHGRGFAVVAQPVYLLMGLADHTYYSRNKNWKLQQKSILKMSLFQACHSLYEKHCVLWVY